VGPARPQFVFFGSSIVQLSFGHGGWGATLADIYARKVHSFVCVSLCVCVCRLIPCWFLNRVFTFEFRITCP
jgi:NhaP-type Na+/H+ or K+/H+ antiporter